MFFVINESKSKILFLLSLFYTSFSLCQDGGAITKNFDLNGEEDVWSTSQSADGFDYIVGSLKRPPNIQGAFIVKTDSCGNIIWSRVLTGSGTQIFRRVVASKDSGAIAVGISSTHAGTTNFSVVAIKWDKNGNQEWARTLRINSQFGNWALAVLATSDNGFLINGNLNSAGYYASSFALKINSRGEFQWMKKYTFFEGVNQRGAIETDDGYVISGDYLIEDNTKYHPYVVKLNKNNGNVITLKSYRFNGIVLTSGPLKKRPGGYLYNALRMFDVGGVGDWRQVIIYLNDNLDAEKAIEFRNEINKGYCEPDIFVLPDGGFVGCFGGIRQTADADIYKVDPTGKITWRSKIGGLGAQSLVGISQTQNQNFIFMGNTQTTSGGKDILWMKVNTNVQPEECNMGESDVQAFDYPITSVNFTYDEVSNMPASNWVVINPVLERDVHNATYACPNSLIVSNDTSVCANASFSLFASGLKSYKWYPEQGIDDPLSQNPTITIQNPTTYYVTGFSASGCSFTDSIFVDVIASPNVSIASSRSVLCNPDSIVLTVSGGDIYQWQPKELFGNPEGEQSKVWVPFESFLKVNVTNQEGCLKQDSIFIPFRNRPPFKINVTDTAICRGDSIKIVVEGGTTYDWGNLNRIDGDSSRIFIAPLADTIIRVWIIDNICNDSIQFVANIQVKSLPEITVSKSNDIDCDNVSAQLNVTGAQNYRWYPGAGLNNAAISNPVAIVKAPTLYKVFATGTNQCLSVDSLEILFSDFRELIVTPDTSVCNSDSIKLSAVGASSFLWYPAEGLNDPTLADPTASVQKNSIYFVTGITPNGCVARDSVIINNLELPKGNISSDRNIVCQSGLVNLAVNGGQSYRWFPSNLFLNPLSDSTTATISEPSQLFVETTDVNGCKSVDSIVINWKPSPVYNATSQNESVCIGDSHQVLASGGNRYLWRPSSFFQNPSAPNSTANIISDTTIAVHIWNDECWDSTVLNVNLKLWPKPNITLSKSQDVDCANPTIELSASGGTNYSWSPANALSNANIANPLASPIESTVYEVQINDQHNCSFTDTIRVNVIKTGGLSLYQLPNAFTPNGDGLNDCFGISKWGNAVVIERFLVYNRWGQIVFSGNKENACWDGSVNGTPATNGAYVYQINATVPCGNIDLKGIIMLIR